MGLYWKSLIVKTTNCDYQLAGKIEQLVSTLCPDCSEAQMMQEAPIAFRALAKLDESSQELFNKSYDHLTADEFEDFFSRIRAHFPNIFWRFAA